MKNYLFCSYQRAGQTDSLVRAVHDYVLDDSEGLTSFVYKKVLWVSQAGKITEPKITNTV